MSLEFKRFYNCEKENRGWIIDKITATDNNCLIGYINVSYIPRENYRKYYSSPIDYMTKIGGWCCGPIETRLFAIRDYIQKDVIKGISWYHWQDNDLLKQIDNMNDGQLKFLFKRLERSIHHKYKRKINEHKNYWVDRPVVDYINVIENRRRQGIGTQLYTHAAQMMREKGLLLRASSIQSSPAKACWENFKRQGKTITRGKYTYLQP